MSAEIGIKPNPESQNITTDAYREGWDRIWKQGKRVGLTIVKDSIKKTKNLKNI